METVVQMAKANGVRWYRHVLGRDDGHVLRKALEFEVKGKRSEDNQIRRRRCKCRRRARVLVWRKRNGCHESSEMESGNWRDCCQSGVNQATPIYGYKPR